VKGKKKHSILQSQEVQKNIKQSLFCLERLVEKSYGPLGKNIIVDGIKLENPDLLNNGSSLISCLRTSNQVDNLIFLMIEDAFKKISNVSGDGTKTFFILISYLILNGFRYTIQDTSALEIKLAITKTLDYAMLLLNERSLSIESKNTWKKVIHRFIPNEDNLQSLFEQAFEEIGKSGQLKVETETGKKSYLTLERGMQVSRGFFSPYFVTDTEKMVVDFNNPYILLTTQKINIKDGILLDLLEPIIYQKRPIVLISPEIDDETLSTLILNKINGIVDIAYIKIPQNFNYDRTIFEDLALYTKSKLINFAYEWKTIKLKDLGQVDKVIISKNKTIFCSKSLDEQESIKRKCQELKEQILHSDSEYDNEKRENRRKNLSGSRAIITIGGITELETTNRRLRSEKGLTSAKSCLYEGIIPGNGFSLLYLTEELENWARSNLYNDYINGANLVIKALLKPFQLLIEQGSTYQGIIPRYLKQISEIKKLNNNNLIYDKKSNEIMNFIEAENIDSFKTIKIGLQTASSLTYSILSIANIII
jgi:chaperonin GroEL